jgi:nicotinamidase-related amidase
MREVAGKLVYESLAEVVHPSHTAVVVVDMQNDYCHPEGVTATSGKVIYLKNTVAPDLSTYGGGWLYSNVRTRPAGLSGLPIRRTVDGTFGHDIVQALAPRPGEHVVEKNRPSGFMHTNLDLLLRAHGINSIVVTGCVTEGCVLATARDGTFLDYYVTVVRDGVGSANRPLHDAALTIMGASYDMPAAEELAALWAEVPAST